MARRERSEAEVRERNALVKRTVLRYLTKDKWLTCNELANTLRSKEGEVSKKIIRIDFAVLAALIYIELNTLYENHKVRMRLRHPISKDIEFEFQRR